MRLNLFRPRERKSLRRPRDPENVFRAFFALMTRLRQAQRGKVEAGPWR